VRAAAAALGVEALRCCRGACICLALASVRGGRASLVTPMTWASTLRPLRAITLLPQHSTGTSRRSACACGAPSSGSERYTDQNLGWGGRTGQVARSDVRARELHLANR
jgi:hypothetical protein